VRQKAGRICCMSFASLDYFLFLSIVILLSAIFSRHKKIIITVSSLIYLGSWGSLTLVVFLALFVMNACAVWWYRQNRSAFIFYGAIIGNFGALIFYKWRLMNSVAGSYGVDVLRDNLIPVGLSYYVFQMVAYLIESQRGLIAKPFKFSEYLFFNSFFAQVTIGPIERFREMASQIRTEVQVSSEDFRVGLSLIFLGLFKKIVVADRFLDFIKLGAPGEEKLAGLSLILYLLLSFFQLYCDFSGYTNIAEGSARLLGFRLSPNFDRPYLATSVPEAWRRWHMSLLAWIKDFIFYPLVLKGKRIYPAMLISFLITGIWHSLSWSYVVWAFYWTGLTILDSESRRFHRFKEKIPVLLKRAYVLACLSFSTLFFMSRSPGNFWSHFLRLFSWESEVFSSFCRLEGYQTTEFGIGLFSLIFLLFVEVYWERAKEWPMLDYLRLACLIVLIASLGRSNSYEFIYLSF
jgi:alginate O-acetyltransferase complex protein AlgI